MLLVIQTSQRAQKPIFTFLVPRTSIIKFRMETVRLKSSRGRAKVVGTLTCVGGSLTFTFWRGKCLVNGFMRRPLIHMYASTDDKSELRHVEKNWVKGSALVLLSHIAWSLWLIFQVKVHTPLSLPSPLSVFMRSFMTGTWGPDGTL